MKTSDNSNAGPETGGGGNPKGNRRVDGSPIGTVRCETCDRTLAITDPALPGTITICPACGSMVQVPELAAAPRQEVPELAAAPLQYGSSSVHSDEVTAEAIEAAGVSGGPPPVEIGGQVFRDDQTAAGPRSEPSSIPPSFESESAKRHRRWAGIALSAGLSIVCLAAVFVMMRRSDDVVEANPVQSSVTDVNESPTPSGPSETMTVGATVATMQDATAPDSDEATSNDSDLVRSDPTRSDSKAAISDTTKTDTTTTDAAGDPPVVSEVSSRPPGVAIASDAEVKPPPPGLTSLDRTLDLFADDDPAADPDTPTLDQMPADLASFTPLLLDVDPAPATDLESPPSLEQYRLRDAAQNEDPLIAGEVTEIRPQSDLAMKVAIKSTPKPVPRLLHLISQLGGVPIEIDLVACDLAGIDVRQNFAPPSQTMRLGELLDRIAASIDATVVVEKTSLRVVPEPPRLRASLKDLIRKDRPGDADAILQPLLPELPVVDAGEANPMGDGVDLGPDEGGVDDEEEAGESPWSDSDRQREMLHAVLSQVLLTMRDRPTAVEPAALRRWSGPLGDPSLIWAKTPSPDQFPEVFYPMSMPQFFAELGGQIDRSILVHWPDLLERQWDATSLVFPDSQLDPATLIERTLSPMQCQVRSIDNEYAWCGNESTYDRLPVVVHATSLGDRRESLRQQLMQSASLVGDASVRWSADPASDGMIMVVPRFIAAQLVP